MDEILSKEFMDYSRFNNSEINFDKYSEQLKKVLKASIAQQLFSSNAYESILNKDDVILKKVIEMENISQ